MPTPNKKASENARYQALRSHDARFDGQFFDLAAQAEKAGYRPCWRSYAVIAAWAGNYQKS